MRSFWVRNLRLLRWVLSSRKASVTRQAMVLAAQSLRAPTLSIVLYSRGQEASSFPVQVESKGPGKVWSLGVGGSASAQMCLRCISHSPERVMSCRGHRAGRVSWVLQLHL